MRRAWLALVLSLAAAAAHADVERGAPLPRRSFFGIQSVLDGKRVKVAAVVPGGTAERLGVKAGDLLVSANGTPLEAPANLAAVARKLVAGDKVSLTVEREGKATTLSGEMLGRPKAAEQGLEVIYDQVVSLGKRIRLILTKPEGKGPFPTLFMIGGIGAYTVDAPFASMIDGDLIGAVAKDGYVTVRVDKPGQGDSEGPPYKDLLFSVEQDAYLQALRLVKTLPYVDKDRIAIFGHSMGGAFAPLVASKEPVKAVIVYGTLFKPFQEYMLENGRRQSELSGMPEDQLDLSQRNMVRVMHDLFDGSATPPEVAKNHPDLSAFIKENFPDGETFSGVGIPFFRELSQVNLAKAWSETEAQVLALYGENDFLSGRDDHERIAAYVNRLHPGKAEFTLLKDTDHLFRKTTSMKDSMERWAKGGEFNPDVIGVFKAYLKKTLG